MFYSREPDYQESDFSRATIHFIQDSVPQKNPFALFTLPHHVYSVKADYLFKRFTEGEKVTVIYDLTDPNKASIYSFWGYWLRWKELSAFIVLFAAMYFIAASITSNPTPEALIEELEGMKGKRRRRKYDD